MENPQRKQSSQLLALAAGAARFSIASPVHQISNRRTGGPSVTPAPGGQDQESTDFTSLSRSSSPRRTGLHRPSLSRQLPSSLPRTHSIVMSQVNSGIRNRASIFNDDLEIDEMSPDEDDRFAESVMRNERK